MAMKSKARKMLFGVALALCSPTVASAYQVDCAILLCLSGGWPTSAPCAHARAVFIRRITPWPIEPPLQIWRCPMRAAMNSGSGATPSERLFNFAFTDAPEQSVPDKSGAEWEPGHAVPAVVDQNDGGAVASAFLHLAQQISNKNERADIDISGREFDFVRSIKVWNVLNYSHAPRGRNEVCREFSNINLGTYGAQGEFRWDPTGPGPVPNWVIPWRSCRPSSFARAVGIEWTDYQGNHGYEVVNY